MSDPTLIVHTIDAKSYAQLDELIIWLRSKPTWIDPDSINHEPINRAVQLLIGGNFRCDRYNLPSWARDSEVTEATTQGGNPPLASIVIPARDGSHSIVVLPD